jgi:SAM-dependent methyltransferase
VIPHLPAFEHSADLYDAIYSVRGKDYSREADYIHRIIQSHGAADAGHLLDVACGTGRHLYRFQEAHNFKCAGLDRCRAMLKVATLRLPHVPFHCLDMRGFDLGVEYDVVTCLFASIAYLPDVSALRQAIGSMARHVTPGGLLIIEPGVMADTFQPPSRDETEARVDERFVNRVATARRFEDELAITFEFNVLVNGDMQRFRETHRVQLFDRAIYQQAFDEAGMDVSYDTTGPAGRGLFVATACRPRVPSSSYPRQEDTP